MTYPIALLAESGPNIGTGHVVEIGHLANRCRAFDMTPFVWVTDGTPAALTRCFPGLTGKLASVEAGELDQLIPSLRDNGICGTITNFRSIDQPQIDCLKRAGPVFCVDELGRRCLVPDAIYNTSIVPEFHDYSGSPAPVHCGPGYLCMSNDYRSYAKKRRSFTDGIREVLVSMGGTDRTQATLRVMDTFADLDEDIEVHIVIGAGFSFADEVRKRAVRAPKNRFRLHKNKRDLSELMSAVDLGLTAGGNTLYELACVGTPALVLYEDEHERRQGEEFERRGFSHVIGKGAIVDPGRLRPFLDRMDDCDSLERHSHRGQSLVDGKGTDRVLASIRGHFDD